MKTFMLTVAACACVALSSACPPPAPVPPAPDASDAQAPVDASPPSQDASAGDDPGIVPPPAVDGSSVDFCPLACANLRLKGCPEGSEDAGAGCTAVCEHVRGVFDMHPECVSRAVTAAAVRACGSVKCQGR